MHGETYPDMTPTSNMNLFGVVSSDMDITFAGVRYLVFDACNVLEKIERNGMHRAPAPLKRNETSHYQSAMLGFPLRHP